MVKDTSISSLFENDVLKKTFLKDPLIILLIPKFFNSSIIFVRNFFLIVLSTNYSFIKFKGKLEE